MLKMRYEESAVKSDPIMCFFLSLSKQSLTCLLYSILFLWAYVGFFCSVTKDCQLYNDGICILERKTFFK
jgi:hypothetical protein